ncbi:hypothetical protein AFA91_02205 [Mycolicibacterium goodii]|uniref:Dimethylallyltranstransferase n=1 Tax=Mycolicibacterium goodii TaxID=134601 RepID=A0A0K0XF45_MYCGD|nr:hypothetical protein AFA91_02205 [Mycolicibacterium goodii]
MEQILGDTHRLVDPALRSVATELPAEMQTVMSYHLGWCDESGHPINAANGKMIRAAATLLVSRAAGGTPGKAVSAAVAVELVHNFSLMHDDVIDRDQRRRHRPTVWTVFGIPAAILVGDALLGLAYEVLADAEFSPDPFEAVRHLSRSVERMIFGQDADIRLESRTGGVKLSECIAMARAKTGALLGGACALGALSAGADAALVQQMSVFGEELGLAFQLIDDVLGIWGDPKRTGKPARSDLQSRKKSLPVVFAMNSGTRAAEELMTLYQIRRDLTDVELNRAARLVDAAGGKEWATSEAERRVQEALSNLATWNLHPPAVAELAALAARVCDRTY